MGSRIQFQLRKGNCLKHLSKIKGNSVNTIIADPPYYQGLTHNGYKGEFSDLSICEPFFQQLFNEFKRILKPDGCVYFFTDWRGIAFYYPLFNKELKARNMIVWDKGNGAGNFYTNEHELILFATFNNKFHKKGARNIIREIKGFGCGAKKTNGEKVHPTQKPIELIEKLITDSTKKGDTVLDPFMGSGTTGVACKNTDRKFIGIEIQEKYFNIAKNRLAG